MKCEKCGHVMHDNDRTYRMRWGRSRDGAGQVMIYDSLGNEIKLTIGSTINLQSKPAKGEK